MSQQEYFDNIIIYMSVICNSVQNSKQYNGSIGKYSFKEISTWPEYLCPSIAVWNVFW